MGVARHALGDELNWAGMAQLAERPTEKPGAILTRVRVPGATRELSYKSHLSLQTLLRCPYSPRGQSHASTPVLTLKIPNTGSHTIIWTHDNTAQTNSDMYVTECIVSVQGHDPCTFSFLKSFIFFDWAGVLWP